jgi:hypothetical protein
MGDGKGDWHHALHPMLTQSVQTIHAEDFTSHFQGHESDLPAPSIFHQRSGEWVSFSIAMCDELLRGNGIRRTGEHTATNQNEIRS